MKTNTLAVHAKLLGCCRLFNYAPNDLPVY